MRIVGEFRRHPSRSWKTADDDSGMRCYLGMQGRVTLRELLEHFAEEYPHVDPMTLALNFATVVWDEPATPEDIAQREAFRAKQADRQERWERDTYARLKAKFEMS
jgi:hypothetical protein